MKYPRAVIISVFVIFVASACASTQPVTDPVAIVENFHEALNNGDLDAAMSHVADDAEFRFFETFSGKAEIREAILERIDLGIRHELSDLQADGDRVTWIDKETMGGGAFENSYEAVVRGGLIVSLIEDV